MRTVIALFDDFADAHRALHALVDDGFDRQFISLVARDVYGAYQKTMTEMEAAAEQDNTEGNASIAEMLSGLNGLLDGIIVRPAPGIGSTMIAGPLSKTAGQAGTEAATEALLDALSELGVPTETAEEYLEGVRRGGTLLVTQVEDRRTGGAVDILDRHNPAELQQRVQNWRAQNWSGFERQGEPLNAEQIEEQRRFLEQQAQGYTSLEEQALKPAHGGAHDFEEEFRQHFEATYTTGTFEEYEPAYDYGYELAQDKRYRDRSWEQVEPDARQEWERREEGGLWSDVKGAVRAAWETVAGS